MTLVSSGAISIGGTATNASIEQEINGSTFSSPYNHQASLNDSSLRTLAGIGSGQISFSSFYGKTSALTLTLTVGVNAGTVAKTGIYFNNYGFEDSTAVLIGGNYYATSAFGSISVGTFKGITIHGIAYTSTSFNSGATYYTYNSIYVAGNQSAGFVNNITVNGTSWGTINAPSYDSSHNTTIFTFSSTTNLFGTSAGATKTVVIS